VTTSTKAKLLELVEDERGRLSTARSLLWGWSIYSLCFLSLTWATVSNGALSFLSAVEVALIAWAAGPRIAQYLGPQVGAAAAAVGQALREKVQARRRPEEGYEVSK
jgi:hypothetical protein